MVFDRRMLSGFSFISGYLVVSSLRIGQQALRRTLMELKKKEKKERARFALHGDHHHPLFM